MLYRIKQVLWALNAAPLGVDDRQLVEQLLSPAEREIFCRFNVNDQNHSIRVVSILLADNQSNPALLKAALLHDVGKTRVGRLSIIDRSVAVAVKALLPNLSKAWGDIDIKVANRFQTPSIVRAQHAEWGAEMAQAAGSDPLTVWLIRTHQTKLNEIISEDKHLLKLLQTADDLS